MFYKVSASDAEYVVITKHDDGTIWKSIKHYVDILSEIDMWDCCGDYYEYYKVFAWNDAEMKFVELEIHGIWHDPKDPLFIKVTDKDGKIYFSGYGTDH